MLNGAGLLVLVSIVLDVASCIAWVISLTTDKIPDRSRIRKKVNFVSWLWQSPLCHSSEGMGPSLGVGSGRSARKNASHGDQ